MCREAAQATLPTPSPLRERLVNRSLRIRVRVHKKQVAKHLCHGVVKGLTPRCVQSREDAVTFSTPHPPPPLPSAGLALLFCSSPRAGPNSRRPQSFLVAFGWFSPLVTLQSTEDPVSYSLSQSRPSCLGTCRGSRGGGGLLPWALLPPPHFPLDGVVPLLWAPPPSRLLRGPPSQVGFFS